MKISEILNEAPVNNFDTLGDFKGGFSFSDKEQDLINRYKTNLQVHHAFAKTPFNFNLYFLNTKHPHYNLPVDIDSVAGIYGGEMTDETEEIFNINIPKDRAAITVVYLSNHGPDQVSMTPWILAHRFGHSLRDTIDRNYNKNLVGSAKKIFKLLDNIAQNMYDDISNTNKLFTMRSARTGEMTNDYEVFQELIAQYLITGKVTINKNISIAPRTKQFKTSLDKLEVDLNEAIRQTLEWCVGRQFLAV